MQLTLNQLLFRTFHKKDNMLQPIREELGLGRGQPRILTYLLSHGAGTQNEIAEYFGIDPASISRMTETLRRNGFLTRTADEGCRRANRLELTEKGRTAAGIWLKECQTIDKISLKGFSEEETQALVMFLQRMLGNMTEEKIHEEA